MHVAVKLFEHNQKAYLSAIDMLDKEDKAAIVHPNGIEKSFIAFKLALDRPEKRILWLGPSEYIYATQLERLARCGGPDKLSNVTFRSHDKLLRLNEEELTVNADYIIWDEFHRCGTEQWGNAVQCTLAANSDAKLLGISAANMKYLDNMRDMAEELFEGHIASELSLGEAIVRGILPAPKCVTTVFRYQNEMERYQKQMRTMRPAALRDADQKVVRRAGACLKTNGDWNVPLVCESNGENDHRLMDRPPAAGRSIAARTRKMFGCRAFKNIDRCLNGPAQTSSLQYNYSLVRSYVKKLANLNIPTKYKISGQVR